MDQLNQSVASSNNVSNRSNNLLIKNLLNLHKPLKYSNIIPKTVYCNLFMNSFLLYDSNYLLISSLLNDKIYQVMIYILTLKYNSKHATIKIKNYSYNVNLY